MYRVEWDNETGGILLADRVTEATLGVSPRPVFWEELDLLGLHDRGWKYPQCEEPIMWCCNKTYYYRGQKLFEAKGANIYQRPILDGLIKLLVPDSLEPVDMEEMLRRNQDLMFLIEGEAIDFIRRTYDQYCDAAKKVELYEANQIDFEALAERESKRTRTKMAIVKQDCDSFDIMPADEAQRQGKRLYATTKVDRFLASFSGGKDSQVVLDLCTRAIPPQAFEVIYSDTGYELPPSLELYEQVRRHYQALYPKLKFTVTRNHESVLSYWDKIGTPSDKHRWCCSVMKTAPLYRNLKKEDSNQQAKVLAFEGTRGEESVKRSSYERTGKGVKHNNVINARPIYQWNTTEVFLYLFKYSLPINQAYRKGKPRVGCLICPFSSEWDDMIVKTCYPRELEPFVNKLEIWAKSRHIPNIEEYISGHKWKTRASGKHMAQERTVSFEEKGARLCGKATQVALDCQTWLSAIGDYSFNAQGKVVAGELKVDGTIIQYRFEKMSNQDLTFEFLNVPSPIVSGLIKRALYKTVYCIHCEVCEVECPTGALTVYPETVIDKNKCTHCHKCLEFHNRGCIVADSLSMTQTENTKLSGISAYGTFGLRDSWLSEYFAAKDDFWSTNSLGKKQVPSFKAWLRDAGIVDDKANITKLGLILAELYQGMYDVAWQIIWINLCHNSPLVKWYISNVPVGCQYSKKDLVEMYNNQYPEGATTFAYALDALKNTMDQSPVGTLMNQWIAERRDSYDEVSEIAVAYSLYKMAEVTKMTNVRVVELYDEGLECGVVKEFGIGKSALENSLRVLNSMKDRVLIAELNMGLDNITITKEPDAEAILAQLTGF